MFGKKDNNDVSIGKTVGSFIKGYAMGYAAVEGVNIVKNAMDKKKENKAKEEAMMAAYSEQLDDILVKPHQKAGGACAEYINNTSDEEKWANLFDPNAPGYAEHGKILDDMFKF